MSPAPKNPVEPQFVCETDVRGIEMLNQHERHTAVRGHRREELLESIQGPAQK